MRKLPLTLVDEVSVEEPRLPELPLAPSLAAKQYSGEVSSPELRSWCLSLVRLALTTGEAHDTRLAANSCPA
jgi:hypothetical protein